MAGAVPTLLEELDEALEAGARTRERLDCAGAHAAKNLAKRGIVFEGRPDDERVDEEPDVALKLRRRPARDRRADDEIVLVGVAVQQGREPRQEGHELGSALVLSELPELPGLLDAERERDAAARGGRYGGPGPVEGKVEHLRRAAKRIHPPLEIRGLVIVRRLRLLDLRQGRERRIRPGERGAVEGDQLLHEDPDGPAVEDGVVDDEDELVAVVVEPEEGSSPQRSLGQRERRGSQLPPNALGLRRPRAWLEVREVDER